MIDQRKYIGAGFWNMVKMPEQKKSKAKARVYIGLILIGVFLYQTISLIFSSNIIQYTPDDGYYYLQLAKHFAESGHWTFDGVHVTNGFHLLWAYLLAGISFIFNPSLAAFPIVAMATSILIICATVIYIGKDQSIAVILWVGYLITNQYFILNAISLTEFPLVILCAYFVITNRYPFIFSLLGVLARTDFIVVPLIFAIASIASVEKVKVNYKAMLGGFIGIAIVSLHSLIITGDVVQVSAAIKGDWSGLYPASLLSEKALSLSTSYFYATTYTAKKLVFLAILLIGGITRYFCRKDKKAIREINGSIAIIIVYTALYWTYAGTQSWYAANLFIPILLIGRHAIETITRKKSQCRPMIGE